MLVVDASAVLDVIATPSPPPRLVVRLGNDRDLHAPYLIDVEFMHGLRNLVRGERVSRDRATEAQADFSDLRILRYPHAPLAGRAWGLVDNLSAYDAFYVALAEALDAPLITCDARLASAAPRATEIELYAPAAD